MLTYIYAYNMSDLAITGLVKDQKKRAHTAITQDLIDKVLVDRYHNGLSVNSIKEKYSISQNTYKSIDEKWGALFKEKMGVKALKIEEISKDQMLAYWEGKKAAEKK